MKKILYKLITFLYLLLTLLLVISIASRSLSNLVICMFSILLLALIVFFVKKNIIKINKTLIIVLLILAILLRIGTFFLHYDKPLTSDYLFFHQNTTSFFNGEELSNRYIATFPYLAPYIILLGAFFRLFNNNNYLLVILLHTIMDIITSIMIYNILRNRLDKKISFLGAILWLINPINIIWATICCPVVVVNCGISIILYVFELIRKNIDDKKLKCSAFLILNVLYGIIIGIFNSFRPIMIIIVIATIIFYIYKIINTLKEKKRNIFLALGMLTLIIIYILMNKLSNNIISKIIKEEASTTPGWTLYLGSNLQYSGMWNEPASQEYGELLYDNSLSAEEVQQELKEKAITQYKQNGFSNFKLLVKKFKVLTNNIGGYTYHTLIETATINNSISLLIRLFTESLILIFILLNIYINKVLVKDVKSFENVLICILITIGMLLSHMAVEVSPRYILPILPSLTIIATYSISSILSKNNNNTLKLLGGKQKYE